MWWRRCAVVCFSNHQSEVWTSLSCQLRFHVIMPSSSWHARQETQEPGTRRLGGWLTRIPWKYSGGFWKGGELDISSETFQSSTRYDSTGKVSYLLLARNYMSDKKNCRGGTATLPSRHMILISPPGLRIARPAESSVPLRDDCAYVRTIELAPTTPRKSRSEEAGREQG